MAKTIKRIVSTSFWTDRKVMDEFSPEDKFFMLYLLTNPHTTQLGIYELPISTAAYELGYSKESVLVLIDRFDSKYDIIKYSKQTGELLIKNYLRYSIIKGGKPVMDCLLKDESQVTDKSLLSYLYYFLNTKDIENTTVLEYIEHLSIYKDIKINNDNDNDNDNERIVPRIVDESYHESYHESSNKTRQKKFVPPTVAEVEEYCKKRQNNIDAETFVSFYNANGWVQGRGKPIKDWKSCVITWEKNHRNYGNTQGELSREEIKRRFINGGS